MSAPTQQRQGERGIALLHTVLVLSALMALTAVGVDIGHLAFTATEVQSAAEVAATAGATGMLEGGSAQGDAAVLMTNNSIHGEIATPHLDSVEVGNYDGTGFMIGGTPANAVRATTSITVNNVFASIASPFGFGTPTSTVTKTATASFTSIGSGQPTLPLAVGDCNFLDPDCLGDACLPKLTQAPSGTNNTAWTGFFGTASVDYIRTFFPASCPNGGGVAAPIITVGDSINLTGGQTNLLTLVKCLVDSGVTTFLVPVVGNCDGNYNGTYPVVGFATVEVTKVKTTGNPKGMDLQAIFNASAPGKPGGGNFGSGFVILVG